MRNRIKAMVWPRHLDENLGVYRYAIVGILVTDKPIPSLEKLNTLGLSEYIVEGMLPGIEEALEHINKRVPNRPIGEAGDVLVGLKDL